MIDSDYVYKFVNKLNFKDITFFVISFLVISFTLKFIRIFSDWLSKKFPSKRMLIFAWVPLIHFSLYFSGLFISFYIIFAPSREFLIGFIISSFLSIGLATKDAGTSIMAGIILLTDKPFQLGDRITFQGHYGEVLEIGLRSVKILTLDKSIVTIPNNRFLTDSVKSNNAGDLGMITTVDIHVPSQADLYKIKRIIYAETKNNSYVDSNNKISVVGKEMLGGHGIICFLMTVKCHIKDARLEKAFQTDLLLAVNKKFKMNGIRS